LFMLRPTQRWHESHIRYGSWSLAGPPHIGQDIWPPRDRDRTATAARRSATATNAPSHTFI